MESAVRATQSAKRDEEIPEPRKERVSKQGHTEAKVLEMSPRSSSAGKTVLPTWLMPVLCTVLIGLLAFVYQAMDAKVDNIKETMKENKADAERDIAAARADAQREVNDARTEVRIFRTYVIQLTMEMKARGIDVPPLPDTGK